MTRRPYTAATYRWRRTILATAIGATLIAAPTLADTISNDPGKAPGPNGNPTTPARGYPARIELPSELAQAIGKARADFATACPGGTSYAWAQVDEGGRVVDIATACAASASVQVIDPGAPGYCAEDDPCWTGSVEDDRVHELPRTR